MSHEQLIRKLIKATVGRAFREVGSCLLILIFFGSSLPHLRVGSARFDGCLLLLAAAVLIAAITLKFTLSEKLLQRYPADHQAYWHRTFLAQAKLLRLVPLWYLSPLCAGILLFSFPTAPGHTGSWTGDVLWVAVAFVLLSWINRTAAVRIEDEAHSLAN